MKKVLLILLTVVFGLTFVGCESKGGKTAIEVQVVKSNEPQSGVSVYMFKENSWINSTAFRTPFYADKTVVTDHAGVARFELLDVVDLNPELINPQTTFYFATFKDGTDTMTGQTAVTIKKGETKQVTIRL